MIKLEDFESVDGNYENCPLDQELLVWTGDSFTVEYVTSEVEYGTCFPANGVEFTHYLLLPEGGESEVYFDQ